MDHIGVYLVALLVSIAEFVVDAVYEIKLLSDDIESHGLPFLIANIF